MKDNKSVSVSEISQLSQLKIIAIQHEKWQSNLIGHPRPQRPGLALAGYLKYLSRERVQIFGKTEMGYLNSLEPKERETRLSRYLALRLPAIVLSENLGIDPLLMILAGKYHTPILVSSLTTSLLLSRISSFLYQYFSKKIKINGVLMDIMGQGVMITGASGVGKSETALELINKGYHLISDDVIEFHLDSNDEPVGRCSEAIRNLMEVRGLGIININDIFGAAAVLDEKKLDLVINLEKWDAKKKYDRLGEDNLYYKMLGVDIPMINIPVAPGRNVSMIIEVAVRYYLARQNGRKTYLELRDEQTKHD